MSRAQKYGCFMVVAATALLSACSSDSEKNTGGAGTGSGSAGSPGSNNLPDPCSLLAASDIEGLTGESSLTGERNGDRCDWSTPDDDAIANVTVYANSSIFDAGKSMYSTGPLSGLGADAYLGKTHDVNVKMASGRSFMAQSGLPPVDGMVSAAISTAGASLSDTEKKRSEASYRLAKIVAGKL